MTAWWGRFRMIGVIDLDRGYGSQEVTKKNKFFFTLIAADSGWGLGGEGGRNSFLQIYFFLELKIILNELIFSLLFILFNFMSCPGLGINTEKDHRDDIE